jgi:tetratricopeptide (TPR) repeat protein
MDKNKLEQLFRFLDMAPHDPFSIYSIAFEYYKSGEWDEALKYFQKLRKDHPDYIGTYLHLGKLWEQLDHPENAIETYESGILVAQNLKDFHSLGELQRALEQARDEYEEDYL